VRRVFRRVLILSHECSSCGSSYFQPSDWRERKNGVAARSSWECLVVCNVCGQVDRIGLLGVKPGKEGE